MRSGASSHAEVRDARAMATVPTPDSSTLPSPAPSSGAQHYILSAAAHSFPVQQLQSDRAIMSRDDDPHQLEEDCIPDPREVLRQIFTREVFDEICSKSRLPDKSTLSEALRYIQQQCKTQDFDEHTTAQDRLSHFGIRSLPSQHGHFGRSVLALFRRPSAMAMGSKELVHLHALARVYSVTNGIAGVSYGGLVWQYLRFHLGVNGYNLTKQCLIGEADPRQTKDRVPYNLQGSRINVTYSLVRGKDLVRSGTGKVHTRVVAGLEERLLMPKTNDGIMFLFHGTSIEYATAIVQEGPQLGGPNTDFGPAFYLTNSLAYALEAAYEVSGGNSASNRASDPTVLIFPVLLDAFANDGTTLELTELDEWRRVVENCRRGSSSRIGGRLLERFEDVKCVIGPISGEIEKGRSGHWLSPSLLQYAFKATAPRVSPMSEIYNAIREGRVQVIRVLIESENEWDPEEEQRARGRWCRGGRRQR